MPASFLTDPPTGENVTDYDRAHCATYLRLLDADKAGIKWPAIADVIFQIDPSRDAATAEKIVTSHMARAKWMSAKGFKQLAGLSEPSRPKPIRPLNR